MNTYDKHLKPNGEVKIKPETTSENISNSGEKTPLPEDINSEDSLNDKFPFYTKE